MSYRLLLRLSSWVYRRLKAGGISVPKAPYQRARLHRASKGKWGELKTALLAEAQATKRSKDATLFVHRLIGRIEEGRVLIDLRTVDRKEEDSLLDVLIQALAE